MRYSVENPRAYLDANVIGSFTVMEAARRLKVAHLMMASTLLGLWRERGDALPRDRQGRQPAHHLLGHQEGQREHGPRLGPSAWRAGHHVSLLHRLRALRAARPRAVQVRRRDSRRPADRHLQPRRDVARLHLCGRSGACDPASDRGRARRPRDGGRGGQPLARRPVRIVNIGNSDKVRLLDFTEAIEESLGQTAVRNYMPMQQGDVPATWAEAGLLQRLTGYRPQTDIRDGIARFVAWYREYSGK
uniref:Uncharacterized protein n=1 Tax=Cereibacter sphaeroides (strain ATCC 17025 / ATH 2.4.3) TaxID=349102 RepID=A4WZQ1_CERS5